MKKCITPVVLAVIRKGDTYLLSKRLEHDKGDSQLEFDGLWQLPGGGLEFGEAVEDCLHREVREELNAKIKNVRMLPKLFHRVYKTYWHGLLISFTCELDSPESDIKLNHEASEWGWFSYNELQSINTFPLVKIIVEEVERK